MFYTIYKTTCLTTGRVYIGKHQTKDLKDGYLGSGTFIRRAIQKYGRKNFVKEILFVFESEEEMNNKEIELVTSEFCERKDTFNICEGGKGGWSYVNRSGIGQGWTHANKSGLSARGGKAFSEKMKDPEYRAQWSRSTSERLRGKCRRTPGMTGKKHSDETKDLMKKKASGTKNSQAGSFWITDGKANKKCRGDIPEGWTRGRCLLV